MRDEILERLDRNLQRVENLIDLYKVATAGGRGRRPVGSSDILRAATVLLHASLEDMFRAIAVWKLPTQSEAVLNTVPLVGLSEHGRAEKFFLGKLKPYRDKSVRQLIQESVEAYANNFSVNSTTDIASFLKSVGAVVNFDAEMPVLAELIERRHHIVHQADRNDRQGQGQHSAQSIATNTVDRWRQTVKTFSHRVLAQIPDDLI